MNESTANHKGYLDCFRRLAHESPLNALRLLKLSPAQLEGLAVVLEGRGEHDTAGFVRAEADLQAMLERRRSRCLTLN